MMKKYRWFVVLFLGLLVIAGCNSQKSAKVTEKQTPTTTSEVVDQTSTPTLFIHGYSGGPGSFGGMIQRLTVAKAATASAVITVAEDGSLEVKGKVNAQAKDNPLIQVLFEDNKSHEWNQSLWIEKVMAYLAEQGVKTVNLVGHSMGGVSSLRYLFTYGSQADLPKVEKFVSIAAPFNGFPEMSDLNYLEDLDKVLAEGPAQATDRFAEYQQNFAKVPKDISVFLIGGKRSAKELGDGTVPIDSALSVNYLFKQNGNPVQHQVITKNAQHSQLHENTEVDQLVTDFLWGKTK